MPRCIAAGLFALAFLILQSGCNKGPDTSKAPPAGKAKEEGSLVKPPPPPPPPPVPKK